MGTFLGQKGLKCRTKKIYICNMSMIWLRASWKSIKFTFTFGNIEIYKFNIYLILEHEIITRYYNYIKNEYVYIYIYILRNVWLQESKKSLDADMDFLLRMQVNKPCDDIL